MGASEAERTWVESELMDDGRLGVPIDVASWGAPAEVRVANDWFFWTMGRGRRVVADRSLLDRFGAVVVPDAQREDVCDLAERFGPLFYRSDERGHDTSCGACRSARSREDDARYQRYALEHYAEPVAAWRQLIGDLRGCLTIASRLRSGASVSIEDWEEFGTVEVTANGLSEVESVREVVGVRLPQSLEGRWERASIVEPLSAKEKGYPGSQEMAVTPAAVVAEVLNVLMTGVSLRLQVLEDRPTVVPHAGGVLGAVGLTLAGRCTSGRGFALCANCNRFFLVGRSRPRDKAAWCTTQECKKASLRAADERRRDAMKRTETDLG